MYQYRAVASKSLKEVDDEAKYHIDTSQIKSDIRLRDLWAEISASPPSGTTIKQCEDLLLVEAVLRATKQSGALQREDLEAARFLIFWTANAVLPTEDFTSSWENAQLADESKPWKFRYVYIITVLSWVIERYSPSDKLSLESQFPLLVPAILSLIDDENLSFKAKGCELLLKFLAPLEESNSDVLQRTNLDSVFQEALYPCLLSIPTITPEAESIHLLQYAYPALFAVIRTRFSSPKVPSAPTPLRPSQTKSEARPRFPKRLESLTRLLRHGILHSYHHTSNPRPIENTSISSYPYLRLSALLLSQLPPALSELGIHTTKHLQDLVRRFAHVEPGDGDGGGGGGGGGQTVVLLQLQCALKVVVAVLRIAIEENVVVAAEEGGNGTGGRDGDQGREEEIIDVDREFGKLVQGEDRLRELLIGNEYFDAQ
ncbi:conserved hypothetical protein [Histoplasma capsulatum H143]|uniref:Uncharacterized protein n=1 Tax=Ajellomyces capsulatus (strain H143) TaxID=544712 RepID=C6HBX9_AJECH|nr:conserved hypothetical protein [Histoplasma capsulatum H143]